MYINENRWVINVEKYIISTKGKSKVFHRKDCHFKSQIHWEDRRSVDLNTVKSMDLYPCKCCFSLRHIYNQEYSNISNMLKDTIIKYQLKNDNLYILTDASCWKIEYVPEAFQYRLFRSDIISNNSDISEYFDTLFSFIKSFGRTFTITKIINHIKLKDERRLGYSFLLENKLKNEMSQIDELIENTNVEYDLIGDNIIILTEIGYWKLHYKCDKGMFVLYHGNNYPEYSDFKDYLMASYHVQLDVYRYDSIYNYFSYIKEHDEFRLNQIKHVDEMPQNCEKELNKYRMMKRKQTIFLKARDRRNYRQLTGFDSIPIECCI